MTTYKKIEMSELHNLLLNESSEKKNVTMCLIYQLVIHAQKSVLDNVPKGMTKNRHKPFWDLVKSFVTFDDKGGEKATNQWKFEPHHLDERTEFLKAVNLILGCELKVQGWNSITKENSNHGASYEEFANAVDLFVSVQEEEAKITKKEKTKEVEKQEQLDRAVKRLVPETETALKSLRSTLHLMPITKLKELQTLIAIAANGREDGGLLPVEELEKEKAKIQSRIADLQGEIADENQELEKLQESKNVLEAQLIQADNDEDIVKSETLATRKLAYTSAIGKSCNKLLGLENQVTTLEEQKDDLAEQIESRLDPVPVDHSELTPEINA